MKDWTKTFLLFPVTSSGTQPLCAVRVSADLSNSVQAPFWAPQAHAQVQDYEDYERTQSISTTSKTGLFWLKHPLQCLTLPHLCLLIAPWGFVSSGMKRYSGGQVVGDWTTELLSTSCLDCLSSWKWRWGETWEWRERLQQRLSQILEEAAGVLFHYPHICAWKHSPARTMNEEVDDEVVELKNEE